MALEPEHMIIDGEEVAVRGHQIGEMERLQLIVQL